ncbi:MAG TPA: plastocyanin/azurin family copper-binding protein [candidate division Zixibacteria bacterium]|nr:plastocyanin/azurin family copper-binding protein [candidate division Zixibacteria bacterium]
MTVAHLHILRAFLIGSTLAVPLIQGETAAGDLYGANLREPAQTRPANRASRYRSAAAAVSEPGCQCNPGLYTVAYLTADTALPVRGAGAAVSMAQKDTRFEPSVLAVSVGDEVSFPNLDPFFHNVFSYSQPKKFDLGRYPQGETSIVRFDKPGLVRVFCEIHSSMRAYVHVLETPYHAVSDERGRFHIPAIIPGTYTLHIWQENLPEYSQSVTVTADSTYIEVNP